MPSSLVLLPAPREIVPGDGVCPLAGRRLILIDAPRPGALRFTAERLQSRLASRLGLHWPIVSSQATPADLLGIILRIDPGRGIPAQGYELAISPDRITMAASDPAGLFYGSATLIQMIEQRGDRLPCLVIQDWPDFPARGVMLDVSRDKVPTMETLYTLVDMLAGWKINQLQLYTEHTFAYQKHPEVWAKASPMTAQEILDLDAYCQERFVELVPNQNSFGHMHRWLEHPRYTHLAEIIGDFMAPWGPSKGPFSLCPIDPGSFQLIQELYDELLPNFSSRMVNVGCDETFDLGAGRSKAECERRGAGRVYLDFLMKIYRDLNARNRTMQFWGDIILHHPELIPELPKDVIALEWGYEADHPFAEHAAQFAAAGIPFYVCPGTSAWCSIGGRSDNALGNLLNAAENGLKHGAIGYLNTDWGDHGHWQPFPISFLGFAAGAAYSWALEANRTLDVTQTLDWHAFRDRAGVMGRLAYELGNVYQKVGLLMENNSALFYALLRSLAELRANPNAPLMDWNGVRQAIDQIMLPLGQAQMDRPDAGLIVQEFVLAARMLRHASRRGLLATKTAGLEQDCQALDRDLREIIDDYREIWLKRNRPGGLEDSVARLEKSRADYRL